MAAILIDVSEDEAKTEPAPKRSKVTRRGLTRRKLEQVKQSLPETVPDDPSNLFMFSGPPRSRKITQFLDSEDDEPNIESIFTNKSPKKKLRRKRNESNITVTGDEDCECRGNSKDDDISILNCSSPGSFTPTPPDPPTPPVELSVATTKRRKPRRFKKAITKLANAGRNLKVEESESDLSIIEVTPPAPQTSTAILVKVRSRSGIQRFSISQTDSFASIIEQMARHEGVLEEQVVIYHNDNRLESYDSPASIKLHIADILDCHIRTLAEANKAESTTNSLEHDPEAISLRIQGRDAKSRITVWVKKREPLERVMRQFAKSCGQTTISGLEFQFDGDVISPSDTADALELEDDFCIDVIGA